MRTLRAAALAALLAAAALAADEEDTLAKLDGIARALEPSFVDVEHFLRYDRGEPPRTVGGAEQTEYIREERPMRSSGYLLTETLVAVDDPMLHPRFIERIEVARGEARTGAKPAGWFPRGGVMVLELEEKLPGSRPLVFDEDATSPWFSVSYANRQGRRWIGVHPVSAGPLWHEVGGKRFRSVGGLIVDGEGRPAGLILDQQMPPDGSWRGSPLNREWIDAEEMARTLEDLDRRAAFGILRVGLDFRSPRRESGSSRGFFGGGDEGVTRLDVPGVRLDGNRLLVMADLPPKTTARLEEITAHLPGGGTAAAEFRFTLKRFGAFVAGLPGDLPPPPPLGRRSPLDLEDRLLLAHEVRIQGEDRIAWSQPAVANRVRTGWREKLHLGLSGESLYLFTRTGALFAVPLSWRTDRSSGNNPFAYRRYGSGRSFSVSVIMEMVANRVEHEDTSNRPLSEEEENRVAWLGVVLQPLDKELARANGVSELTRDGSSGGIVSFVYEGSPAAEAGIEVGTILLRVHSEDRPEPMDVTGSSSPFPMPDIGNLPPALRARFFDQMGGTPWPSVENPLTKMLTRLGEGSGYELEYVVDGEVVRRKFTVTRAPDHYGSAKRFKSEKLGMTVRDLTFEVRRYYQLEPDAPGVIVSRLEPGERAAVAGVGRFEIVTHVDGEPIRTVSEFEEKAETPGEHQFALRHQTRTKTVKIEVPED